MADHALTLAAQAILAAAALWLGFAGIVAAVSPETARGFIGRMGSTPKIHFTEHFLRGLAGVALILAAEPSKFPNAFHWVGVFVAVSSLLILISPREWHARYSRGAAQKLGDATLRILGPVSLAAGAGLIWAIRA